MITGTQQVRLVVADDHPIIRDGLRRLLEEEPDYKVVGEAQDGAEAIELVRQLKPDILLLDLLMPKLQGMEALRELSVRGASAPVRIIVLTAAIETSQIVEALQLGARGIVLKDAATELLVKAVRTVHAGDHWVQRAKVSNLVQHLQTLTQAAQDETKGNTFGLTPRELEVVSTVVAGFQNKEIAAYWEMAEDTVKHHLGNIFDKLGVSTRLELALFAVNHRLPLKTIDVGFSSTQSPKNPSDKDVPTRHGPHKPRN
jgi:two-component system, NarL family, nitrate/nitrite response regulator NarL